MKGRRKDQRKSGEPRTAARAFDDAESDTRPGFRCGHCGRITRRTRWISATRTSEILPCPDHEKRKRDEGQTKNRESHPVVKRNSINEGKCAVALQDRHEDREEEQAHGESTCAPQHSVAMPILLSDEFVVVMGRHRHENDYSPASPASSGNLWSSTAPDLALKAERIAVRNS